MFHQDKPFKDTPAHRQPHRHEGTGHQHSHGTIDPSIVTTRRGLWAVKWSFLGLMLTAFMQAVIVWMSGSVALLADTIHNVGDAATALPLGIAFVLARRPPSSRFTYGLGRAEDLAGLAIVGLMAMSALVAGYQSLTRLFHPQPLTHVGALTVAAIIGFVGNEAVALFRIKVGKEIGSAALVADGYHARTDGLTSLAVLGGAVGAWLGYPLADPLMGLLITLVIVGIVWQASATIGVRLLDGVDPALIAAIKHAVQHMSEVREVTQVRVRWLGHRLHAELNITVSPELSVAQGHAIAAEARHQLLHHLPHLTNIIVHVDPIDASGEEHHQIVEHVHGDLPAHAHL